MSQRQPHASYGKLRLPGDTPDEGRFERTRCCKRRAGATGAIRAGDGRDAATGSGANSNGLRIYLSAACTSSIEKASNLCMLQGLFNIGRLNCDCTQPDIPGVPIWECVGTAACKK